MEDYSNDPVLKKFPCPLFKAQESEQKRLAALTQKVEQEKLAKKLIKSSLSGQALNKKIVFDTPVPSVKEEPVPVSHSKKLFAEEEENEEFDGDQSYELDASFKRFKNSNESKIIGLQSRFAHDPRFKIDERFIDDEDNHGDFSYEQFEAKKEEEKQLDILEEVLGKPLKRKYNQSEESKHHSIIIPRYDPTKAESQKFKIRKVHKLEPYQLPQDNTEEENAKPEVSKERFYEISETFKKDFNDDQFDGQTFSLTKLFGRPAVDSTVDTNFIKKKEVPTGSDSGQKSKHESQSKSRKKSAKGDSDEDEDEDEDEEDDEDDGDGEEEDNEDEDDSGEEDNENEDEAESDFEQSNVQKPMAKVSREIIEKPEKRKAVERKEKDRSSKSESAQDKSNKKIKFRENSKVSNPLLKYERFFFTEDDKRFQNNTFYSVEKIKSHIHSWKEKKIVMTTALTKKRRHFKHVSKLKITLEGANPKDKHLKKKYRILKKTTKKH